MATSLSFSEFDAKLKQGTLTESELNRCVEIDPTVSLIRLRFKPHALSDAPSPGYDLDREVYLAQRAAENRGRAMAKAAKIKRKRVTAEGDSWFNLPPIVRPKAIADRLKSNKKVDVQNIAKWGDTLADILGRNEYIEAIERFKPNWFILSAGGNDIQQALEHGKLIIPFNASVPIPQSLSQSGVQLLAKIAEGYRRILNDIAIRFPTLPTVCYAYDYPRPTVKGGKYIGQYLQAHGYPPATWDEVARMLIDKLTETLQPVVAAFPGADFLDCRGLTASHPFFDDMHPEKDGFSVLAGRFEKAFGVAAKKAAARLKASNTGAAAAAATGAARKPAAKKGTRKSVKAGARRSRRLPRKRKAGNKR